MVRFMVGEMNLQQVQALVDGFDEAQSPCQGMEGADAAVGQAATAVGDVIVDIGGGEQRPIPLADLGFVESPVHAALAVGELLSYLGVHSKSLSVRAG